MDLENIRGDTFKLPIQLKNNDEVIKVKVEKMYFTIKDVAYSKDVILQKKLDDGITFDSETGIYLVEIKPEDTDNLNFGDYEYDLEIINNGEVETPLIGTFKITKEITHKCNEV